MMLSFAVCGFLKKNLLSLSINSVQRQAELATSLVAVAPQQDNVPWHTANTAQEQLKEHNKGPKVLTGSPNSPDPNLIKHL